jgi:anthranilate synthase/aminodeoxychorismate synthase-like glutamine amidotransferase
MIDNYDSFTYNLVQYFGELGADIEVYRNDQITVDELADMAPSQLVISPGPGEPVDGGISNEAILRFTGRIPVLGVCLGHQCLGEVFGGRVIRAARLMHGKTSAIHHEGQGVFAGLPSPFEATRYHSLIIEEPAPPCLEVTARTQEGEIMGVQHRLYPTFGVQFHPESILTECGKELLRNFLEIRN